MRLFISNSSSRIKTKAFLIASFFVYLVIGLMLMVGSYLIHHGSFFAWDKYVIVKNMFMNAKGSKLDAVFIGSSRVQFHISTYLFKKNNIAVYNLGINGKYLGDYPWIVKQVIILHPKSIVISISVDELYKKIEVPFVPALTDIKSYILTKQSSYYILQAMIVYLKNLNPVYLFSSVLYSRMQRLFDHLSGYNFLSMPNTAIAEKKFLPSGKQIDCTPMIIDGGIRIKSGVKVYETLVECTNGDGIWFGQNLDSEMKHVNIVYENSNINKGTLRLLNYVLDMAQKNGIKPIVVLLPSFNTTYFYGDDFLKSLIRARVIDFSNISVPCDYWMDHLHFNYKGRAYYSGLLIERLRKLWFYEELYMSLK